MEPFYIPRSAMVIAAHPDDIEFTCAGTLARWAKAGCRVSYILCTSGDAGLSEAGMTRTRAAEIREAEQQAAAAVAGAAQVIFLREPDGLLQPTLELRLNLVRQIRRFRPEVIMCGDPTFFFGSDDYINHPDHRAAATAALDAAFPAAGQPNVFEELAGEGLRPHKPRKVYITGSGKGDTYINITETMEIKIAALKAHTSQITDWNPDELLRQWASETAKGKEMVYAEAFRVFNLLSDEEWEKANPSSVSSEG